MTDEKLNEIIRQVENFPPLPATATQVMAITGDPESTAQDLMQVILPDQAMCATILKIANSAFFGIPREVSTIEKAIVVLDFDEIRNIVLGKAIFSSFQKIRKTNREQVDLFWEHSFNCGLAAKVIAEHLGYSASELFIAGLMHDIGKLAMLMSFPQDYSLLIELSEPHLFRSLVHERETYSVSHDEIGMRILKKWHFPEPFLITTGYHHRPEKATTYRPHAIIIQMADLLSLLYCSPHGFDSSDIATIFHDFLPENRELWLENGLHWDADLLGVWHKQLQSQRKNDMNILDAMTSS